MLQLIRDLLDYIQAHPTLPSEEPIMVEAEEFIMIESVDIIIDTVLANIYESASREVQEDRTYMLVNKNGNDFTVTPVTL